MNDNEALAPGWIAQVQHENGEWVSWQLWKLRGNAEKQVQRLLEANRHNLIAGRVLEVTYSVAATFPSPADPEQRREQGDADPHLAEKPQRGTNE